MNDLTSAQPSRRLYRWNVPGGTYFVTTVTRNRMSAFSAAHDAQLVLDTLRAVREIHPFTMPGYVIMPDHVHLLLHLGENTSISTMMHSFKRNVTRNYECAHPEIGSLHLWQKGFWDHLILDERELDPLLAYIHRNPVKHGLVQYVADYRFSSRNAYQERDLETDDTSIEPAWVRDAE